MVGGPGSGKATQCQRLAAKYGFHHLSMGRVLWDEACKLTTQGQQIRDIMLKGALVPSVSVQPPLSPCPVPQSLSRPQTPGSPLYQPNSQSLPGLKHLSFG